MAGEGQGPGGEGELGKPGGFARSDGDAFLMAHPNNGAHHRRAAGPGGSGGPVLASSSMPDDWKVLLSDKPIHFTHRVVDGALTWNKARLEVGTSPFLGPLVSGCFYQGAKQ